MRTKYVVSLAISQALITKGHQVVEVKKSSRVRGRLVFGFADTPALRKDFGPLAVSKK